MSKQLAIVSVFVSIFLSATFAGTVYARPTEPVKDPPLGDGSSSRMTTPEKNSTLQTGYSLGGGAFVSDDFNVACNELLGHWTPIDPLGDASFQVTGVGTGNARLEIRVPGGQSHDLWTRHNRAPRLMQSVSNSDYDIEVKFESLLTQKYQGQGFLVQENDLDFIRFDTYSDGNRNYMFAASIEYGSFSLRGNAIVPSASPLWMRVSRAGNQWTQSYSTDGTNFYEVTSFSHVIDVSSMGPFALNYDRRNNAPAHTAIVDYVLEASNPFPSEDGTINGDHSKDLSITVDGPGGVSQNPDLQEYDCGSTVTLTATPLTNSAFIGWFGDYEGSQNPISITMDSDINLIALFEFDGEAPVISNIQIQSDYQSATLTWNTDIPATSRVDYGQTTAYELGFIEDSALVTQHLILLPNLNAETLHNALLTSVSADQIPTGSGNQTFQTAQAPPQISSVVVIPGETTATVNWTTDVPSTSRVDYGETSGYELGAEQDSLMVTQHSIALSSLGSDTLHHYKVSGANVDGYASETNDSTFRTLFGAPTISNVQVSVTENSATISWSTDQASTSRVDFGESPSYELGFVNDPALVFQHSIQLLALNSDTLHHYKVTSVNLNGDIAETADNTFSTAPLGPPTLSNIQVEVTGTGATITWDTDQAASSRIDYGETVGYELGFVEDPALVTQHSLELTGLNSETLHHFFATSVNQDGGADSSPDGTFTTDSDSTPPVISQIQVSSTESSATVTWITDQPSTSRVDYGETPGYELGFIEDPTLVTEHSVEVLGLSSGTLYHYSVTSANDEGDETSSADATFQTDFPPSPSGILSDDFNVACDSLLSFWTFVDPNGLSSATIAGVGTQDARLEIALPAGVNHDAWVNGLTVPRVMQSAANTDFEIETKFDSPLTQAIQGQGLLVRSSDSHFLRFEYYYSGSQLHVFGATIQNGSATVHGDITIPNATPQYLRITRVIDDWDMQYSADGQAWTSAFAFVHTMNVNSVGPYALNYVSGGSTPAHTAVVDYFFNTAAPILNEDGQVLGNGGDKAVMVSTIGTGTGTVDRFPDLQTYPCGSDVTLTAQPDPGSVFIGWTGDVVSQENPITVTLLNDLSIVAEFELDVTPPILSNIQATVGPYGAAITWDTDEDSDSRVDYGETTNYELGFVEHSELTQTHTISLFNLTPDTLYHYQVTSSDINGFEAVSIDLTFQTTIAPPPHPSGFVSDDFNALNIDTTIWSFFPGDDHDTTIQPVGVGTQDARIQIALTNEQDHKLEDGTAPRLMQQVLDVDFDIEAKFDSPLTNKYQIQGIVIEESEDHFLRCDFFHDGAGLRVFWGAYLNGSLIDFGNFGITLETPYYLRVSRATDTWSLRYSDDGQSWITADVFNYALTVDQAGLFAGNVRPNANAQPPAHTSLIDYCFVTTNPIVPEDGIVSNDTLSPLVYSTDSIAGKEAIVLEWKTDELATSQVRYGLTANLELGLEKSTTLTREHSIALFGLTPETVYFYEIVSGDALDQESAIEGTASTQPLVALTGPQIDIWYGAEQTFGLLGTPQLWANIMGNITAGDGVDSVTYELNSGDSSFLSLGPDDFRLADLGDFNAEIDHNDLRLGANAIVLRATDGLGNETTDVVIMHYQSGNVWADDYDVDWSAQTDLTDVSQPVDGLWEISGGGLVPLQMDYDRVVVMGEYLQWQDYEVTVPITVHALDPNGYDAPSNSPAVGIIMRWPGHIDWDGSQPRRGWWPLGAIGLFRFNEIGAPNHSLQIYGNDGIILDRRDQVVDFNEQYIFKMRVETIDSTQAQYRLKAWKTTDPEPPAWDLEGIHVGGTEFGSLALLAHHVDCTFGNVSIRKIGP